MNGAEILTMVDGIVKTITDTIRSMGNKPILFEADCKRCNKVTTHISHLDYSFRGYPIASTAYVREFNPLNTCLMCGFISYRE